MVTIIVMIPDFGNVFAGAGWVHPLELILVYASLILTVVSLIDYLVKNKDVLGGEM
jgi:CDP-diacylglycerol--glycerol-3-phosphate 3-phosphatidyltransferase